MSSGKQISFALGEISPEASYNTNESLYAQALKKLSNGIIRTLGGASNRQGSLLYTNTNYQRGVVEDFNGGHKNKQFVQLFSFIGSDDVRYILEVQDSIEGSPMGWDFVVDGPYFPASPVRVFKVDGTLAAVTNPDFKYTFSSSATPLNLKGASIEVLGDSAIVTFNDGNYLSMFYASGSFTLYVNTLQKPVKVGTPAALGALTFKGQAPTDVPVSYLITQVLADSSEVFWVAGDSVNGHPHAFLSSSFTFDAPTGTAIKQYNIYRAANSTGFYSLVGRVQPSAAGATFKDFITVPDITVQPPVDMYLYPEADSIRRIVFYKERSVIAYKKATQLFSLDVNKYNEGQLGASKLGSPIMFGRPLTPNLIDAFSFTVPANKLRRITQVLVLNRLVVFTTNDCFVIKGGEQGILTSSDVNPEWVGSEGASDEVVPVKIGTTGFYVTPDKIKLNVVSYGSDSQGSGTGEISSLSSHLFKGRDIVRMEVIEGEDSVVWVLKKDGTLLSLTYSSSGVKGFARHNTDGFIESMCVQDEQEAVYPAQSLTPPVKVLYLSVIREGVRYYEKMPTRADIATDKFIYADAAKTFGSPYREFGIALNITSAATYAGGELLTVTDKLPFATISTLYAVGNVIDFSYDSGIVGVPDLRFRVTVESLGPAANEIKVKADEDVPLYLQDIESQALTAFEKVKRQSTFLNAYKFLTGLTHLANKEVSVYAEGQLISSPLNEDELTLTVANDGSLELPDYYNWGYVGLPYVFEMETLDLDASDQRTFTDKGKLINSSGIAINKTVGGLIGTRENNQAPVFEKITQRDTYGNLTTTGTTTGIRNIPFPGSWNSKGSIVIRQVDPLPISVLAVYPKGVIGD